MGKSQRDIQRELQESGPEPEQAIQQECRRARELGPARARGIQQGWELGPELGLEPGLVLAIRQQVLVLGILRQE